MKTKLKAGTFFFLAFVGIAAAGCEMTETTQNGINQQSQEISHSLDTTTKQGQAELFNPLVVTNKVWAGDSAIRIQRGIPLPPKYETPQGFTLVAAEPMTMADIGAAISAQTGIPVHVDEDKKVGAASTQSPQGTPFQVRGFGGNPTASSNSPPAPTMPVAYEGPLSGLLERVSGYFGVAWRYDGGTINVSRYETRTFVIETLPGSDKLTADIQGGSQSASSGSGGGSGSGSGSSGSSSSSSSSGSGSGSSSSGASSTGTVTLEGKSDVDIKYWEELKDILTSMLNGEGTVVLSPSLGTITVTTTPEMMRSIASYIAQENERMSRQIAINVEIYNVTLNKSEDFNVGFAAFLRKFGGQPLTGITGGGAPADLANNNSGLGSSIASATIAILNPQPGSTGISDVFEALSQIGNTTRVAQFPMVTLNNRPVTVRVGEDIGYAAQVSVYLSTTTTTTTPQTTIQPNTISDGFTMVMSPRLLDDGRILMHYSLTDVDLLQIEPFTSGSGDGESEIQIPKTADRSFNQQFVIRSGSTLVIGGLNQKELSQNAQGVGAPYDFLFGGGASNNETDTMMLIAITPQVIDLPQAEHG